MSQDAPVRPAGQQLAALAQWRALALEKMPYVASILLRLDVWNAPGLGTYAVDDRWRLYIDFEHAMTKETVDQGADSLLHECGHILGEHARLARDLGVGPGERRIWNVAADAAWNDDLEAAGCVSLRGIWVTPDQIGEPTNKTPQHYYGALTNKVQRAQGPRPGQGDGRGQSSSGQQRPTGTPLNAQPDKQGLPYKGCGSGAGSEPAPCEFGDHPTGEPVSPIEAQAILIQTAEEILKSRGKAPAGLVETAEMVLQPTTTPWQRLLSSHLRAAAAWVAGQVDQSYQRRSRRRDNTTLRPLNGGPGRRMIKAGWVAPKPMIEVIVDTSGSMSVDDVATCRSEIEMISRRIGIRGDQLMITEVDAAVQSSQKYVGTKALGGIKGRGGTDMTVGITHALERTHRPDIIVCMTDGFTGWPAHPNPVPLIALIVEQSGVSSPDEPPRWIKTVRVQRQQ